MSRITMIFGCILLSAHSGGARADPGSVGGAAGAISNLGTLSPLNPGVIGGGETLPGAVLVKITGEVHCLACTLEELGLEATPGNFYQFSQGTNHLVIKITKATPDFTWGMVERHKLFLTPGEDPAPLHRLFNESRPGKRIEVTGGVAPEVGGLVPLQVVVQ